MRYAMTLLLALVLALAACGDEEDEQDKPLKANAGADFTVTVGESPKFDGCASTGDIKNYKWMILEAPEGHAGEEGKMIREVMTSCSFTLENEMVLEEVGQWVVQLEVGDNDNNTSTDTVTVTVQSGEASG